MPRGLEWMPLAILFFGPLAFGATEPWSLAILEALIFCLAAASPPRPPARFSPLLLSILGLLAIGAVQMARASPDGLGSSFMPSSVSAHLTGRALLLWAAYGALLWTVPKALPDRPALRRFAWGIFLLGVLTAVVGLIQLGQGNTAYYGLRPILRGNAFGPYANSNHAASLMVMSLFMGAGLWLSRWRQMRDADGAGRISDIFAVQALVAFLLCVIAFAVFITRSRGGLHSSVLTAALCAVLTIRSVRSRALSWFFILVLLGGLAGFAYFLYQDPKWIGLYCEWPDRSLGTRFSIFRSGWRMFLDHPLFGAGLGATQALFPFYQERALAGAVEHLHNDWLELLCQTGAAGFLAFFLGFAAQMVRAASYCINGRSWEKRCLTGGAAAACLAAGLHGLSDFSLNIPANAALFFSLAAFASSAGSDA